MEEEQKMPEKELQMQFTIGKSYGLSNNSKKISDYKEKLENISKELRQSTQNEYNEAEKLIKTLIETISSAQKKITASHESALEKLEKMMDKLTKYGNNELFKEGKSKNMAEETLNLAFENYKQNMKALLTGENFLSAIVDQFSKKIGSSFEEIESKRLAFIERLAIEKDEFREFELGWLYGDALRISLSENIK